ncbi:MAG TPA: hypothetical protein VIC52_02955 [Actinomycetota bacterium]|jgi:hypothetical protein
MTTREELEGLPTKELYDRTIGIAKRRLDVGFFWDLLKALPVAEEVIGDDQRSKTDIRRPLALLNDLLYDADSGPLGEALRPMYVDYLLEHEGSEAPDATEGRDDA